MKLHHAMADGVAGIAALESQPRRLLLGTAEAVVGAERFRAAGHRAQAESVVVLRNDEPIERHDNVTTTRGKSYIVSVEDENTSTWPLASRRSGRKRRSMLSR